MRSTPTPIYELIYFRLYFLLVCVCDFWRCTPIVMVFLVCFFSRFAFLVCLIIFSRTATASKKMLQRGLIFVIPNALATSLMGFGDDQGGNVQKIVTSADFTHLSTAHPPLFRLSSFVFCAGTGIKLRQHSRRGQAGDCIPSLHDVYLRSEQKKMKQKGKSRKDFGAKIPAGYHENGCPIGR